MLAAAPFSLGRMPRKKRQPPARSSRKLKAIHFAPILAILTLLAWALASPIGAGPDDDFHLVSIWCAQEGESCEQGESATTRVVSEAVLESPCYAQDPERSAACQERNDFVDGPAVETDRGNFVGAYPPVYYSAMSVFVGQDAVASALLMRFANILLFVALSSALALLLPTHRRSTLVWMWLVTTMPMGLFLIASNNPSGWAVVGVGSSWLALLGYLESSGWRKAVLGSIFAITALMAAGSRGDAAIYVVLGIAAVFALTVPWRDVRDKWKDYTRDAVLPAALVVVSVLFFLSSRQTQSGISGFGGGTGAPPGGVETPELTGFAQLAYNLLNMPFLWAGNFGEWGLGWLDTSMPAIVSFGAVGVVVAVSFVGLSEMWLRKLIVVAGAGFALWALPLYVLTQGGDTIGEQVQPRYILPLIVLFAGLALLRRGGEALSLTRLQLVLVIGTLSVVNFVALHMNMRRYITGIDEPGWNLNAGIEWWWEMPISPMVVWIVGSAAYAALVAIVATRVIAPLPVGGDAAGVDPVQAAPITR